MFHILGFLFIVLIGIIIIGLMIVGGVLRAIFGLGRRSSANPGSQARNRYTTDGSSRQYHATDPEDAEEINGEDTLNSHPKRKKIFTEDDGEYVDFEEIKEDSAR